jgi:hypothetical protein
VRVNHSLQGTRSPSTLGPFRSQGLTTRRSTDPRCRTEYSKDRCRRRRPRWSPGIIGKHEFLVAARQGSSADQVTLPEAPFVLHLLYVDVEASRYRRLLRRSMSPRVTCASRASNVAIQPSVENLPVS